MISRYETVLSADVDSTDVAIVIDKDGYEHNFTLQYISTNDYVITPAPVTMATFAFGKFTCRPSIDLYYRTIVNVCFCADRAYFQIQFGPIDYCLNWGVSHVI